MYRVLNYVLKIQTFEKMTTISAERWRACTHQYFSKVVAERSVSRWRLSEKTAGGIGSENADMSNVKECEKHSRRKSKVSCSRFSEQGKPAPKMRTKVVIDGNQVNSPEPSGCDEDKSVYNLIGLKVHVGSSRKEHQKYRPYQNRLWWTSRVY